MSCRVRAGVIVLLSIAAATSGCSSRQAYEGLQAGQRAECAKLPEPERSRCLESTRLSHKDYEMQRGK